ncbi:MAG: D-alanyl-D-alanine carboxypeptidase [Allomuricauda sp.]|nr:MAG: D-alanyl-D-alanine carboxypeptidase [Allomuricauda sp.]
MLLQFILNQRVTIFLIGISLGSLLLGSCSATKAKVPGKLLKNLTADPQNTNHFMGILVIDPVQKDTLINYQSDRYFTPASNVKIVTLYAALELLPEVLPALHYVEQNDTLYIAGTGNPTLLHPDFNDTTTLKFLKAHNTIAVHLDNYIGNRYGPGWAWEDYDTYFSPEMGPLPLFGNVVTVTPNDLVAISPQLFEPNVFFEKRNKRRDEFSNTFYIPNTTDTLRIPFVTSKKLTKTLLQEALKSEVILVDKMPSTAKKALPGIASDSLYKQMMLESDNFLAEQIMLMVASQVSDTLSFQNARNRILENELSDLSHEPRWVDGSGLSRYNLFTPDALVHVLQKIHNKLPKERLFDLFPRWDENGTLQRSEGNASYIIAKSGALGNNYNLSGYLLTKSGKVLVFSFMNNHFRLPTAEVRKTIRNTLRELHEAY